jgi:hypothetical protein
MGRTPREKDDNEKRIKERGNASDQRGPEGRAAARKKEN